MHYLDLMSYTTTPYSMNSLFGELFKKFGGVLLEVCETISGGYFGGFGEGFRKKFEGSFRDNSGTILGNLCLIDIK